MSDDDFLTITFVDSSWDRRREEKLFMGLIWISSKSILNPARILADFTLSELTRTAKYRSQLPGNGQSQLESTLLPGFSD